jgi:uncharacterized membrane protein YfcA
MKVRRFQAIGYGGAIGTLGGLIGLGGAEFRLPVLMGPFGYGPRQAVLLNLLISLVTLLFGLVARMGLGTAPDLLGRTPVILSLIAGAMTAAYFGTALMPRLSDGALHRIIGVLLLALAALLAGEALLPLEVSHGFPALRIAVGLLCGLGIGLVSSLLGVAGGELIIPALVLAFGFDIKTAGTASLMISLPTVLVGILHYARQGAYRERRALSDTVIPMAVGSAGGALAGAALVGLIAADILKALLGAILAISATKILRHPNSATSRSPV